MLIYCFQTEQLDILPTAQQYQHHQTLAIFRGLRFRCHNQLDLHLHPHKHPRQDIHCYRPYDRWQGWLERVRSGDALEIYRPVICLGHVDLVKNGNANSNQGAIEWFVVGRQGWRRCRRCAWRHIGHFRRLSYTPATKASRRECGWGTWIQDAISWQRSKRACCTRTLWTRAQEARVSF